MIFDGDRRFVSLREGGKTTLLPGAGSTPTATRRRGVTRTPSRRTPTRGVRGARLGSTSRIRQIEEGAGFTIDGNLMRIEEIKAEPVQIIYEFNSQRYTLVPEEDQYPILIFEDDRYVLRPLSEEQLAAIGGTPLPTRPTTTAIPDEERGSIRSGGTRRPTPPGTTARGLPKAPKRAAGVRPAKNQDVQKTIKDLQNQKGKPDPKAMKRVIETLQGLQKP